MSHSHQKSIMIIIYAILMTFYPNGGRVTTQRGGCNYQGPSCPWAECVKKEASNRLNRDFEYG